MYECEDKMVSHPNHYQTASGLEAIDVIEAFTADLQGIEAVDTGNILRYVLRWKQKNGVQDLHKAIWYLQHLIEHLENPKEETEPEFRFNVCSVSDESAAVEILEKIVAVAEALGYISAAMIINLTGDELWDPESLVIGWPLEEVKKARVEQNTTHFYSIVFNSMPKDIY